MYKISVPTLNLDVSDSTSATLKVISAPAIWFILLHLPLAFLLFASELFATLHALLTIFLGLYFIAFDRKPIRVIFVAAYITGVELLWRLTGANIFWETGKYAVSALLLLAILKYGLKVKKARWPVMYFAPLLPSIALLPSFDREVIAFNLAGPFALAVAVMFFSMIRIDREHLARIMIAMLAPAVSLGIIVASGIIGNEFIVFGSGSNFQTSGDYGPNQVSSTLALGVLAAFFLVVLAQKKAHRFFFLGISLWLLAQSALTFSRGGLYTTVGALFISGLFLIRVNRIRVVFIFSSILLALLSYFVILPYLDNYTQDALSARLSDMEATGRIEIMKADWMVFQMYPAFGVGPGQSRPYHELTFRASYAHTEYSRLLSEHGSLGLLALIILGSATFQRFIHRDHPFSKAFILGLTVWAILYMFHASTRLVAPSFLYGMGAARFVFNQISEHGLVRRG